MDLYSQPLEMIPPPSIDVVEWPARTGRRNSGLPWLVRQYIMHTTNFVVTPEGWMDDLQRPKGVVVPWQGYPFALD